MGRIRIRTRIDFPLHPSHLRFTGCARLIPGAESSTHGFDEYISLWTRISNDDKVSKIKTRTGWRFHHPRDIRRGKNLLTSLRNRDVPYLALVFCISFFAVTGNVYGQAATASISGRVSDPTGAGVPDAAVTIKNTGTSATGAATTDGQGRYTVPQLGIGAYDITVSKTGFQT